MPLYNEPSPLEVRVLTRRFGVPNSTSIDTYLATEGYKAFLKAVEMTPEQIVDEVKASNLRGRGGARLPVLAPEDDHAGRVARQTLGIRRHHAARLHAAPGLPGQVVELPRLPTGSSGGLARCTRSAPRRCLASDSREVHRPAGPPRRRQEPQP